MGCDTRCDEQHTYAPGCTMRASAATEPRLVVRPLSSQCANSLCENQPHQGRFVLLTFLHQRHPMALFVCAPCAEEIVKVAS